VRWAHLSPGAPTAQLMCGAVSGTPACVIARASGTLHAWWGLLGKHGCPPSSVCAEGGYVDAEQGFLVENISLTSEHCFSGAQMLSTGLKSAANLGFRTKSSFNEPHQVPEHLQVLGTLLLFALTSQLMSGAHQPRAYCRDLEVTSSCTGGI